MIPDFDVDGNLPPGIHWATWPEFAQRFGITKHRQKLLGGLQIALDSLSAAGCRTAYIGGSFVTDKRDPSDFDGCWDTEGMNFELLQIIDPVLLQFTNRRAAQKAKYYGELFPAQGGASSTNSIFLDFFQIDKETGKNKGIIALDLRESSI